MKCWRSWGADAATFAPSNGTRPGLFPDAMSHIRSWSRPAPVQHRIQARKIRHLIVPTEATLASGGTAKDFMCVGA